MTRPRHELAPRGVQPIALRQGAMAAHISLSEATFKKMQQQGLMPRPRLCDGILIYIVEEVTRALYDLPVAEGDEESGSDTSKKQTWVLK
jgi:hypothetical protein